MHKLITATIIFLAAATANASADCPAFNIGINRDGFHTYVSVGYKQATISAVPGQPFDVPIADLSSCGADFQPGATKPHVVPLGATEQSGITVDSFAGFPVVVARLKSSRALTNVSIQLAYTIFLVSKENVQISESIRDDQPICKGSVVVSGPQCASNGPDGTITYDVRFDDKKCWFAETPNFEVVGKTALPQDGISIMNSSPTPDGAVVRIAVGGVNGGAICAPASLEWVAKAKSKWPYPPR